MKREYGKTSSEKAVSPEKKEKEPSNKEVIKEIIDKYPNHPDQQDAMKEMEALSEEEIQNIIKSAIDILSEGTNITQNQIGGGFVDETGKPRNRSITRMDIPELNQYKFLKFLAAKFVPLSDNIANETLIHREIQDKIKENKNKVDFDVPKLVQVLTTEENHVVIQEKLPASNKDASIQKFASNAKLDGISVVGYSPGLEGSIFNAFSQLHGLGFFHGDIQEGNVYLTNIDYSDVNIPTAPGKKRPRKIRMIFGADIKLLDFERTHGVDLKSPAGKDEIDRENNNITKMLDEKFIEIEKDSTPSEIGDAVDEWQAAI